MKDFLAVIFSIYYLLNWRRAEDKMHRFKRSLSRPGLHRCWEKAHHPIIRMYSKLRMEKIPASRMPINIPRPRRGIVSPHHPVADGELIEMRLFYAKPLKELKNESELIFHVPGGGFLCCSPATHEDYLIKWAVGTQRPIISMKYSKQPFPAGFNDCFEAYRSIRESNGKTLGININGETQLQIIACGDSAGGNLATSLTMKCLELGTIPPPDAVHLIYPCLDLENTIFNNPDLILPESSYTGDAKEPELKEIEKYSLYRNRGRPSKRKNYEMRSRCVFVEDNVLPLKYLLIIAKEYMNSSLQRCDPATDYILSPTRAPKKFFQKFPPTFIHVGECDPLSDDSREFIEKIRINQINPTTGLCIIRGVSHAYMQIMLLLPEAQFANQLSIHWFNQIFNRLSRAPKALLYDELVSDREIQRKAEKPLNDSPQNYSQPEAESIPSNNMLELVKKARL